MITKPGFGFRIGIILALLVLICCVPLVSAEERLANNSAVTIGYSEPKTSIPPSNQTLNLNDEGKAKLAAIEPFLRYKENETFWQRKISSDLLYLVDPNHPEMGTTREQVKKMLKENNLLIYSDDVKRRFDINQIEGKPVGDHVLIYIDIKPSVSNHNITPYITNITNVNEAEHRIAAWVDLNNIEPLAKLNEVIG